MEARILPHNLEAEQSVLGAMIVDVSVINDVVQLINAESFYHKPHKLIFQAIIQLSNSSKAIDYITLADELNKNDNLEIAGGMSYLTQLSQDILLTSNAKDYARIIAENHLLRSLIKVSTEVAEKAYNGEAADALLEEAERRIFAIGEHKNTELTPIAEVLTKAFEMIETRFRSPESLTGMATGLADLDHITAGLHRSDLVLLAARPSMGKTALGLNICRNIAKSGKKIVMFSLEMAMTQYVERMIAAESLIELDKIKSGQFEDNDWPKLIKGISNLSKMQIHLDDTMGITVTEMMAKCRKLKRESGLDLVLIDYLQLMGSQGAENRQQEISLISRSLKGLARELDVPVIALSQLSRAPEIRADHRPILSDLRESGAIEQDADIVMFLYRGEYYNPDDESLRNVAELIVSKHRNGETGSIDLHWMGQYQLFRDLARRDA